MRMLCICAKGEPHGYLAIGGQPLDAAGVARSAGITTDEAETLMAELDRWGVFSRDRKRRIYSRRMVKDEKKAREGRKNAKKRWPQPTENADKNSKPNGGASGVPSSHMPSASSQRYTSSKDDGPPDDHSMSAEELYWSLVSQAEAVKITRSLMGKALKQLGDADAAYDALSAALKAKDPRRYFSAVAHGKRQGGDVLKFPSDPEEPQWVREARASGDVVELEQREPRRWRHAGDLHDDSGKVVGW
jgi:hypothetical protein